LRMAETLSISVLRLSVFLASKKKCPVRLLFYARAGAAAL
jgi:hypothetical protein